MKELDSIFLKTKDKEFTYRDVYGFASSIHNILAPLDIKQENPIGIVAEPDETSILTIASCWILGIPFVMFPVKLTESEFELMTQNIKISALIGTLSFHIPNHVKLINKLEIKELLWRSSTSGDDYNIDKSLPPDQIFGYFFTSGTTSSPKTVPLKRKNIIAAANSSLANIPMQTNELWLHVLPLHHIGGISMITRALFSTSGIYFLPEFNAANVNKILQREEQIVGISLVPTQLRRLLELDDFRTNASFKAILLGGGPISEELLLKARERNIPVVPSFGMTETTAQCIAMPFSERFTGPVHSCGKPMDGIEMKLVSNHGETQITIHLRGDQIFDGYAEADLNSDAFDADGWFNTGDYATVDDQGYVHIIMRRSDRIISGGENINPVEIEGLLQHFPGISDIAIIGLPDQEWGQIVTAAIVLSTDEHNVSLNDIKSFLNKKISPFKIPKQLIMVPEIPRTASGKIKRFELLKILSE